MSRSTRLAVLVLAATWIAGCGDPLERVAKDWCMTIRASQVIPVYPMTEDLQPGDVFLVFTPVSRQTKEYKGKGFLPLDDHVVRLHGLNYDKFYEAAYWDATYAPGEAGHPRGRLVMPSPPAVPPNADEAEGVATQPGNANEATAADKPRILSVEAPAAAFPSYSFTLKRGSGIKVALPIKGIPFGMGLMGARSVSVTVGISEAYTYGAEKEDFLRRLHEWWKSDLLVPADLRKAAARLHKANAGRRERDRLTPYLRVVTRVYMAGKMNVTLARAGGIAFGADLGLARPFDPPTITDKDTAANYQAMLETLNGALNENPGQSDQADGGEVTGRDRLADLAAKLVPGGSIRIVQATASSVSMVETFERPLVLGYLGFDVPILFDENLGLPLDTRGILEGTVPEDLIVAGALRPWQNEWLRRVRMLELAWACEHVQVRKVINRVAGRIPELKDVAKEPDEKVWDKFWKESIGYASDSESNAMRLVRFLDEAVELEVELEKE